MPDAQVALWRVAFEWCEEWGRAGRLRQSCINSVAFLKRTPSRHFDQRRVAIVLFVPATVSTQTVIVPSL